MILESSLSGKSRKYTPQRWLQKDTVYWSRYSRRAEVYESITVKGEANRNSREKKGIRGFVEYADQFERLVRVLRVEKENGSLRWCYQRLVDFGEKRTK